MNKKVCEKCGNSYDDNLLNCPFCSNTSEYNIKNPFIEFAKDNSLKEINQIGKDKNELKDIGIEPVNNPINIITPVDNEDKLSETTIIKKENIINNKNNNMKKKKKSNTNNKNYSYLLLIVGLALSMIITFASIQEFVLLVFVHYVFTILSLMIAFNFVYRNNEIGFFISIISSVSMIFMLYECDYISAVIGVYIFTSSFIYLVKK